MSVYETKTVRIHLRDRGQYVYLMLTQFDGEDHLLADEGWWDTYIHCSIISRTTDQQDAATGDVFGFIRQNEWLQDTPAEDFLKDLQMERIDWSDIEDGDHLTKSQIDDLAGRIEVSE